MAQIVPKLNLNKTPSLVESNSLIFAKNIRLDVDTTIHRDYGVFPMSVVKQTTLDKYINYGNILSRIIEDIKNDPLHNNQRSYYYVIYNDLTKISNSGEYKIVGIIPNSNEFYIFIHGTYKISNVEHVVDAIICYDEKYDKFYPCNCNWNWSGGTIDGCVINNLVGDKLLNIGETSIDKLVPFKSINLNKSSIYDSETIYTQIPDIPITNLTYAGNFSCIIPNGVYQFFVRYRIRKDFYTDWFPASSEIFVGNSNSTVTSFGTLDYVNTHRDSDTSFILAAEHLLSSAPKDNTVNYDSYQLGFILSHDDAIYARAWKHFNFNVTNINFDYKVEDAEEIEVIDLLKSTYGLYNVGNITTFKNKLYISNYTESDFNEDLQSYANKVSISTGTKIGNDSYAGYSLVPATINGDDVTGGLKIEGVDKSFSGDNGIFKEIINKKTTNEPMSIAEAIESLLSNGEAKGIIRSHLYDITIRCESQSLSAARNKFITDNKFNNTAETTYSFNYVTNPTSVILITADGEKSVAVDADLIISNTYNLPRYLNKNCKWINANGRLDNNLTIKIKREVEITITTKTQNNGGGITIGDDIIDAPIIDDNNNSFWRPGEDTDKLIGGEGIIGGTITNTYTQTREYYQTINIEYITNSYNYFYNSAIDLLNYTTLIPYQKYKFYIHFVKSTGEVTNGYYCATAGEIEIPYAETCNSVIYPIFNGITIPEGYEACFFSIIHTKINTATIFNISNGDSSNIKEGSCFDINMMLIPGYKGIHIKQGKKTGTNEEIETFSGHYYYSSDTSSGRYFGADGIITLSADNITDGKLAYALTDYSVSETENTELIKCTPYLNSKNLNGISTNYSFEDYTKMNLLGYICSITPLIRERCLSYYNDGSSVYRKTYSGVPSDAGLYIHLKELSKYNDADDDIKLSNFLLKTSNNVFIYSNYNLNYVTLSEEPKMSIKTWYNRPANSNGSATEKQEDDSNTNVLRLVPSQLMSDIYTLPSMYRTYTRKVYYTYSPNETTVFNNTVRSSVLYGDENQVNILTFDPNDYYNIPTNRGIIVNMAAIGEAILVHTKDSIFKFSGYNTIQSSDGEIQMTENKPFDTGVSELFGSDFGFAGLQNKNDHIITENGYMFFDRDSRIVYMYSGQGQIIKISESIEKLFRCKEIDSINFANDYYNNRFFMSIMFYDNYVEIEDGKKVVKQRLYPVTLSFNTSENSKAFVSLHDFYYHYAFNTKTNCYFLTSDNKDICYVNKEHKGCYTKLELTSDKIYPQLKNTVNLTATDTNNTTKTYELNSYNSVIDIIVNENYETIKQLNAVNWCGIKVKTEFTDIKDNDVTTLLMAEDINYDIPCKAIRVYTDICTTPLCDCTSRSNDYSIKALNSYKYPFYNQGVWTFNYFRNILNSEGYGANYSGDNNSLIEGKYFVVRFVFDEDFKFETLSLNYNNK